MISPLNLLKQSIRLFFSNFTYLLKFYFVSVGVSLLAFSPLAILLIVLGVAYGGHAEVLNKTLLIALGALGSILGVLAMIILNVASFVQYKSIVSNERLSIKDLFLQAKKLLSPFFSTGLLSGLAILGGTLFFIIPGIIFSFWFYFSTMVVLFENISGVPALSRSKQIVRGRFLKLVWYSIFPGLILALLSLVIGMFSAISKPLGTSADLLFSLITMPFGVISTIYSFLVYQQFSSSAQN